MGWKKSHSYEHLYVGWSRVESEKDYTFLKDRKNKKYYIQRS